VKGALTILLLGVALTSRAQEIEPAVNTSSPSQASADAAPPVAPASTPVPAPAAPRAAPATKSAAPATKSAATAKPPSGQKSNAHDQITLDPTQITGNKELPKVMYIVPWKRGDIGDQGGGPGKSLIDEALSPVDRDVFRRQNRYFASLQAESAAAAAKPTVTPAPGATGTLPAKDEK
jgi:hypothetical protein